MEEKVEEKKERKRSTVYFTSLLPFHSGQGSPVRTKTTKAAVAAAAEDKKKANRVRNSKPNPCKTKGAAFPTDGIGFQHKHKFHLQTQFTLEDEANDIRQELSNRRRCNRMGKQVGSFPDSAFPPPPSLHSHGHLLLTQT
ncbi:hypothetical protein NPIL_583341 [Nephila pilipes]|uniref:Uncharacterized protein n=1 Tax=Nephila pilipes TaxID=299642 RepID=A0A8X6UGD0_NEPPI|nr:hypothetical protein NPIL_583341 [Nephila pilipes]